MGPEDTAEHKNKKATQAKGQRGFVDQGFRKGLNGWRRNVNLPRSTRQPAEPDQFFDWSTRRFFLIQGIIARNFSPTCSI